MNRLFATVFALALTGALGGLAWWQWGQRKPPAPDAIEAPAATPATPEVTAAAPASQPVPEPPAASEPVGPAGIDDALAALIGRPALLRFVLTDDFAHRLVATVDNLPRAQASARLWPLQPTAGRFTVTTRDGQTGIDLDNAARYTPLVLMVESVDAERAADLYVKLLPQLQQAYEALGFPGQRFHARLLAVIDHLLAAPTPQPPVAVRLPEIKGPLPSQRPWVRYAFADPALEQASAGQKMLVRVGPVNARRLKARLAAFKQALLAASHASAAAAVGATAAASAASDAGR